MIDSGNTEAQLLKAHALINRKDFSAAEELAQRVLAADTWSIDALLLLGLAAKWRKQSAAAIRHFKQAAYAHHECWPAHYYLADLYRASGEIELARRSYRAAIQLLSGTVPRPMPGIKYVPFGLPVDEVRFLCEHQLAKLPAVANKRPPWRAKINRGHRPQKFVIRFIEEARDHINRLNDGLAALRTGSADKESIIAFSAQPTLSRAPRACSLITITETAHS